MVSQAEVHIEVDGDRPLKDVEMLCLQVEMEIRANAVTNSTSNVGVPLERQISELIENPYFAPDASCDFDTYQLQCIPGEHQECPIGFGQNEDGYCNPKGECVPGYYSESEDESGQCYPDTEPCYPGQIRVPNEKLCDYIGDVCSEHNQTLTKSCFEHGIFINDYPSPQCLTSPDLPMCEVPTGGCPKGFTTMHSQNFTTSKCVPKSLQLSQTAERKREVNNENRCAEGYKLNVPEGTDIWRTGGPIGSCTKIH
jgi:hypothetical protein